MTNDLFRNHRRLINKTLNDGLTPPHTFTWTYRYGTPNYNTIGTIRGPNSQWGSSRNYGTQPYPNSAALYYNDFSDPSHNSEDRLAHNLTTEFRGHDVVLETDPTGAQTEHWFYQGEAVDPTGVLTRCIPYATGGGILGDTCFKLLQAGEFLKGKEYHTCVRDIPLVALPTPDKACVAVVQQPPTQDSRVLQETVHSFALDPNLAGTNVPVDLSADPLSGLWRAFAFESQTEMKTYDPIDTSVPPLARKTKYFYDPTYQAGGVQYGNLSKIEEYNGMALARTTKRSFLTRNDGLVGGQWGSYIVDRMWGENVYDGNNGLLSLTHQFYDAFPTGTTTGPAVGTKGELWLTRKYSNVPLTCCTGITLLANDAGYAYDGYGNQTAMTTYAMPGTYLNGVYSTPGNGSAARTTTTAYDTLFNVFPTQSTNPLGQIQRADYDFQMGTLLRVTRPNTTGATTPCGPTNTYTIPASEETTCAQYDVFGRMVQLVKPGDSTTYPTVQATYDDLARPFRYQVERRETANTTNVRIEQQFYDGLGRKIQIKSESGVLQNIVVDTRYDGLNRVTEQSQPHYASETAGTFYSYTNPGIGALYNATTTSYDTLGRPQLITAPDTSKSRHFYGITVVNGAPLSYVDTVDPNRHRIQQRTDALGRLVEVDEINGNCGDYWSAYGYSCTTPYTTIWTADAVTKYSYTPLDLLSQVTDANGNLTSISYDSLGRKTAMSDPDMGAWSYLYDANGNLTRQTDARGQRICFYYDALNRLTGKHYRTDDACPASPALDVSYNYDEALSSNGKGQRTSMSVPAITTRWQYDARGRKIQEDDSNIAALPNQTRSFHWTYDSADRVQTITYPAPSNEVVTYAYDAAWRPASVCSSLLAPPCYAQATGSQPYTALDQPTEVTFGTTGALQTWSYNSPLQRLAEIKVGPSGCIGSGCLFDRTYSYDNGGNVATIGDVVGSQTQHYSYDERDRLTHFWTTAGLGMAAPAPAIASDPPGGAPKLLAPALTEDGRRTTDDGGPTTDEGRRTMDDGRWTKDDGRRTTDDGRWATSALLGTERVAQALRTDLDPTLGQDDAAPTAPHQATTTPAAPVGSGTTAPVAATAPARPDFRRLPLAFMPNLGQTDASVRYMVRGMGGTLFFSADEAVLALPDLTSTLTATNPFTQTVVRLRYDQANPAPQLQAGSPLPGVVNYLIGDTPAQWHVNIPTYAVITATQLYNGIDLRYDGTDGHLKSSYIVAPGAAPANIRWRYLGPTDVRVDTATGNLLIRIPARGPLHPARTLIEQAPVAWQDINGQRVPVTVRFDVGVNGSAGFVVGSYDPTQPLTIDPILSYATYHGGSSNDKGNGIAVDTSGNAYLTGYTASGNFPTQSPQQPTKGAGTDAFISKLNPSGSALVYSTFLGGNAEDRGNAIALDTTGNVYLTGETASSNFPTTNGFDKVFGGGICETITCTDVFMTKLNAAGSAILYSTYLGGNGEDEGEGIAVDPSGNAYITGATAGGLTMKSNAYDNSYNGGDSDAFLTKLKPSVSGSSSHLYSTYLGGGGDDQGNAIAVDSSGKAYITGETASSGFPTLNGYDTSQNGASDVFVSKLNPAVSGPASLLYSTFLGGSSYDKGNGITVDSAGAFAYITGYSKSDGFPTLNAWQPSRAGEEDAILVQLNPAATGVPSLLYSSYLGGSDEDRALAIARDSAGNLYLTGLTRSSDLPMVNALQPSLGGGVCGTITCTDAFVTMFDLARNTPIYETYLGGNNDDEGHGIAVDTSGAAYLTGFSQSPNFPTASPRQGSLGGGTDAFIAKLTLPSVALSAATANVSESAGVLNLTVTLSASSTQTVTVDYLSSNGTAKAGSDYGAVAGSVVFAPGQTSKLISIPIINDLNDEPNETFTLTLSNPGNAKLGTPSSTTVTITDNDALLQFSAASYTANEKTPTVTLQVKRTGSTAGAASVSYQSFDLGVGPGFATADSDY
ncbi:MAG TPA: SBBP repeat-containing protein, partial [Roseiflexaceae bacterium]